MTGAQRIMYTTAIALSALGIMSTIAGWVIPQPMIQGAVLAIVIAGALTAWIVFIFSIVDTRRAVRIAEQKRLVGAVQYTGLGRRLN